MAVGGHRVSVPAGGDSGAHYHYETGKISPSIDLVVRFAEAFDVATDYLLIDGAPRRPLNAPVDLLGERLTHLDQLSDGLLANTRIRAALDATG